MVSGGICEQGLGNLVFHAGNVNSFSYKQVLKFYHDDMSNLPFENISIRWRKSPLF